MDWVFQSLAGPIELYNPLTTQGLDAMAAKGLLDAAGKAAFLVDGDGDYPA